MSELKCCKRCGAYLTCEHKGECCVECDYFDPVDIVCMAGPEKKSSNAQKPKIEGEEEKEIDPATFLFEEDDEDDDLSDLPDERDVVDDDEEDDDEDIDDDFDFEDDDDW